MAKWPILSPRIKNTIAIWCLSEYELIFHFWGHTDLKQPRNSKLDFKSALPKSTESHLYRPVDFISCLTFWSRTYSESLQNFRSYDILHYHVASVQTEPAHLQICVNLIGAPCTFWNAHYFSYVLNFYFFAFPNFSYVVFFHYFSNQLEKLKT